jgi:drug/metabolite transporter (DMT)-like permease
MRILLRLYPATWRARYEDEFLAVLEERPLSPFDVIDIMLGALDARLRPRSLAIEVAPRRYQPVHPRISGYAAIAGGALALLMVAIGLLVPEPTNGSLGVILYPVVAIALLVALLGLSAAQGRRLPALTWAAVVIPAAGLVASLVGELGMAVAGDRAIVGELSGWQLWSIGIGGAIVGSILFAAATVFVGVLSRGAAITLLAGSLALGLIGLPVAMGLFDLSPSPPMFALLVAGGVAFCLGWIWLGIAAAFPARGPANGIVG